VPGFSHGLSVCSREAVLTVKFANRTTGLIVSSAFEDGPRAGGGDTNTFSNGGEFGDKVPTRRGVEGEAVGCFDSDRGSNNRPEAGFKACGYPFSLSSGILCALKRGFASKHSGWVGPLSFLSHITHSLFTHTQVCTLTHTHTPTQSCTHAHWGSHTRTLGVEVLPWTWKQAYTHLHSTLHTHTHTKFTAFFGVRRSLHASGVAHIVMYVLLAGDNVSALL
jgi:hypothetical protein